MEIKVNDIKIWNNPKQQVVSMEVYVARQPILDRRGKTVAYELLYRNNSRNSVASLEHPDEATIEVLVNALLHFGLERISDGKPCFVNFTQDLLLCGLPHLLPAANIVVELLEDIEPTPSIVEACSELKRKGFRIALDDMTFQDMDHPLLDLADYAKIDFTLTTPSERQAIARKARNIQRIQLLAEKVETWDEFEEAKALGFTYFQGFFFCKPVLLKCHEIPQNPMTSFADLYMELHRDEPDMDKLARAIENDVSLSYTILRMTRTPPFMTRHKVRSVKQALMLLGIEEMKKIVYLLSLKRHTMHPSLEPLRVSLIRAKLCEQLARLKPEVYRPDECFLIGLLSLMDVLLGVPMDQALPDLPLAEPIVDTLLGKDCWPEYALFKCALLLENGQVREAYDVLAPLNESMDTLYRCYVDAVTWADEVFPYATV